MQLGASPCRRHGWLKDAKLYPGGARPWDWRETGTHHNPGIQPADVVELLDHGAEVVVLSRGVLRMLKVCPETLALLQTKGVRVHILPTGEAVTPTTCCARQSASAR